MGICPDMNNNPIELEGQKMFNNKKFLIQIKACKGTNKRTGESCASSREIEEYVNAVTISVISKQKSANWERRDELPAEPS